MGLMTRKKRIHHAVALFRWVYRSGNGHRIMSESPSGEREANRLTEALIRALPD